VGQGCSETGEGVGDAERARSGGERAADAWAKAVGGGGESDELAAGRAGLNARAGRTRGAGPGKRTAGPESWASATRAGANGAGLWGSGRRVREKLGCWAGLLLLLFFFPFSFSNTLQSK